MARYEVQHSYRSNDYGPYERGTQVEMDPAEADWINRDSPGTLREIDPEAQAKAKREAREAREKATAKSTPAKTQGKKSGHGS